MHIHDTQRDGIFSGGVIEWRWDQRALHGWLLLGSRWGRDSLASIAQVAGRLAWRQTIAGDLFSGYATATLGVGVGVVDSGSGGGAVRSSAG